MTESRDLEYRGSCNEDGKEGSERRGGGGVSMVVSGIWRAWKAGMILLLPELLDDVIGEDGIRRGRETVCSMEIQNSAARELGEETK